MISDTMTEKIYFALNKEYMRRLLTKYFWDKGFKENMDARIYPPALQDLAMAIPQLVGKLEIEPQVNDVDPTTGIIKLSWNLFVLGNKRMFLGESTHSDLNEIKGPLYNIDIKSGIGTMKYVTPRRIINFIVELLGEHKQGDLTQMPKNIVLSPMVPYSRGIGDTSGFYRKRPV